MKVPLNEPSISNNFGIRNLGNIMGENHMIQDLHRHDFFFILIITRGKGSHTIDFTPYTIKDNTVFFMRPGQVHELHIKAGSQGYLLEFKTDFYNYPDPAIQQIFRKVSGVNFCQLNSSQIKKLVSLMDYIYKEYNEKQSGYIEIIKANLHIFFIELVRYRQHQPNTGNSGDPYTQEKLEALFELLEKQITTHKQVSVYADMLHLSTYQLNSITKKLLGKTCSELINNQIILEAKRYLLATSNQVTQIAYQLGYEDVSYFIRFFKKHTGYSPEAFRIQFR